jgi:hypothetical protein
MLNMKFAKYPDGHKVNRWTSKESEEKPTTTSIFIPSSHWEVFQNVYQSWNSSYCINIQQFMKMVHVFLKFIVIMRLSYM